MQGGRHGRRARVYLRPRATAKRRQRPGTAEGIVSKLRIALIAVAVLVVGGGGVLYFGVRYLIRLDPFMVRFEDDCGACHGAEMQGTPIGTALVGVPLQHGETLEDIERSIANGFPERGMPAWSETLDPATIRSFAILIAERRAGRVFTDFRMDAPLEVPAGAIESERHRFRIEPVGEWAPQAPVFGRSTPGWSHPRHGEDAGVARDLAGAARSRPWSPGPPRPTTTVSTSSTWSTGSAG